MSNLQIRLDDDLKNQAQQVANELGMDLTTAVRVFLKQMVNDRGLPFKPELAPFYSRKNQEALERSITQIKAGNVTTVTMEQLESMD